MNIENCVYRFINNEGEIIYIGKAKNLIKRLNSHNHLPQECYKERQKIEFVSFETEEEMNIAERYFIAKIKPKYNIEFSRNDINFTIERLECASWENYSKEKTKLTKIDIKTDKSKIDENIKKLENSIEILRNELREAERESPEENFLVELIIKKENELNEMKREIIEELLFTNGLRCEDGPMKDLYIKYATIDHEEIKLKVIEEIIEKEYKRFYNKVKEKGFYSRVELYELIGIAFIGAGSINHHEKWKELVKGKTEADNMQMKVIKGIENKLEHTFGTFHDELYYYEHHNFGSLKVKNCTIIRKPEQI